MIGGYVKAFRRRFEHPLFKNEKFCRGYAWDWMVAMACISPQEYDLRGTTVHLARGQFVASPDEMAEAWHWSRAAVRRFLTRLETDHMIDQKTGHKKTVITICNYEFYQSDWERTGQTTGQTTGQKAARKRPLKEEGQEGKEEEEVIVRDAHTGADDPSFFPESSLPKTVTPDGKTADQVAQEFETIWPHWPKQSEKKAAKAMWSKVRKSHRADDIRPGLQAYVSAMRGNPRYTKAFHRWLRDERWNDDPDSMRRTAKTASERLDEAISSGGSGAVDITPTGPRSLPQMQAEDLFSR